MDNLIHSFSDAFTSLYTLCGWINRFHSPTCQCFCPSLMLLRNSLGHLLKNHLDPTAHSYHEIFIVCSKQSTPASHSLLFSNSCLFYSYTSCARSIHTYSPATSLIPWHEPTLFHVPELRLSSWAKSLVNFCLHHISILSRSALISPLYFSPS